MPRIARFKQAQPDSWTVARDFLAEYAQMMVKISHLRTEMDIQSKTWICQVIWRMDSSSDMSG
jgi:hypothetical protein